MAIAPTGTKQKTYYVREDLARIIAMIASRHDRRESDVVSEALDMYINNTLTPEERRVFGYQKEQTNGHETNGHATESGNLPGTKKRARKADGSKRRSTE